MLIFLALSEYIDNFYWLSFQRQNLKRNIEKSTFDWLSKENNPQKVKRKQVYILCIKPLYDSASYKHSIGIKWPFWFIKC